MKAVTIVGARPQFIKAAALSRAIREDGYFQEVIVHTGQHYDANMNDIFFEQMEIPKPQYNLEVKSALHGQMTGKMLEGIESILLREKPDIVIVYGDTNSTLAGSIAAKKMHIRLAHVEAGLRSFNMSMPEEINRILTDRISDLLFCPSSASVKNLYEEGFRSFPSKIYDVGDIMKDVARYYKDKGVKPSFVVPDNFFLATIHRAENTDDTSRLLSILQALQRLSQQTPVFLPLHPRTLSRLTSLGFKSNKNFIISEPVGYLEMVYLLRHCKQVITDSGGLQKEAYYFQKCCVTTRDQTEWTELADAGYNIVATTDTPKILEAVAHFENSPPIFDRTLYGDGKASHKILNILKENCL
jgi:UDP-GlcNAc3NAcA epimerase